ncbi:MAG: hypothetical protein AB1589_05720 [Cyanobacteriota bacterium]
MSSTQKRNGVPPLGKRIRMLAFYPTVQGARSKSVEQRAVASLILAITEVTIWQLLDFFLSSSLACSRSPATLTPQYPPLVTCQRG